MLKVLVPVNGSENAHRAVQHLLRMHRDKEPMEVHLLNVQSPFPRYISRFLSRDQIVSHHLEQGAEALRRAITPLEAAGIPCRHHSEIGDKATAITRFAKRQRCDLIIMGTSRKSSFSRFLGDSVTNQVMELAEVPVKIIPGEQATKLEKFGIPACLGLGLTIWYLADE